MEYLIYSTDSYKLSHYVQYPSNTTEVYSYFESRGISEEYSYCNELVFFGLGIFLKRLGNISAISDIDLLIIQNKMNNHLGGNYFNFEGFKHLNEDHLNRKTGKIELPILIKSVREGAIVPTSNVLFTVQNTCPRCYWLTNYIETYLVQMWYPISVATLSREIKKLISSFMKKTGGVDGLEYKLHNFGVRGSTSMESAAIGGAAHLVNFYGTDNLPALKLINDTYEIGSCNAGYSIPAAEHSTITSWGKGKEADAYKNMLEKYPTGLVAVVSDSYDIFNACSNIWGNQLKDQVLSRDGVLVIRPDSGNPVSTIMEVLHRLYDKFGGSINQKGFKVLDGHVRVIQGDGVDYHSIKAILTMMVENGFSAENIAFGMGGALLQKLNRDSFKFAFKCSNIIANNVSVPVFKSPIGDNGKNSKKGKLKLVYEIITDQEFNSTRRTRTVEDNHENSHLSDSLIPVFMNGETLNKTSFEKLRDLANADIA